MVSTERGRSSSTSLKSSGNTLGARQRPSGAPLPIALPRPRHAVVERQPESTVRKRAIVEATGEIPRQLLRSIPLLHAVISVRPGRRVDRRFRLALVFVCYFISAHLVRFRTRLAPRWGIEVVRRS